MGKTKKDTGLYVTSNGYIYYSYYCNVEKRSKTVSTRQKDTPKGWLAAREFKANYIATNRQPLINKLVKANITFTAFFAEYLSEHPEYAPGTITHYHQAKKDFLTYLPDKNITAYTEDDFKLLNKKLLGGQIAINTANGRSRCYKAIFNYAVEIGLIKRNPVIVIKEEKKPVKTIDIEKIRYFINECKITAPHLHTLMIIAIHTGLRSNEIINLKWNDIDFRNHLINVHNKKAKRYEQIPLLPALENMLFVLEKNGEYVSHYRHKALSMFWKQQRAIFGSTQFSFHDLRRYFITVLAENGVAPLDLLALARHKDLKTTLAHYRFVRIEELKNRVEGIKLL